VAKNARIFSAKVLDDEGNGTFGGVFAALDVIVGRKRRNPGTPMVVNLSLSGDRFDFANEITNSVVQDEGIVVIAAAGNDRVSCENLSPASAEHVLTVGASRPGWFGWGERRATFSNYGSCIDIHA